MHWTGQSEIMVFKTIPATPDDGKRHRESVWLKEDDVLDRTK